MIKILLALLLLTETNPKNDLQGMKLKGKVKSATTIHYADVRSSKDSLVFNTDGNVLGDYLIGDNGFCWQSALSAYAGGKLVTRNCFLDDTLNSVMTYSYGKKGNLVQLLVSDPSDDSVPDYATLFKYNNKGQLLSMVEKTGNEISETCTFKYDKRGNEIEKESSRGIKELYTYDSKGNMIERNDYKGTVLVYREINSYNASYQLVSTEKVFNYGVSSRYLFTFDATGNKLVRERSNDEGLEIIHFSYTYDDHQNWIREIQSIDGKEVNLTERRIEYYE